MNEPQQDKHRHPPDDAPTRQDRPHGAPPVSWKAACVSGAALGAMTIVGFFAALFAFGDFRGMTGLVLYGAMVGLAPIMALIGAACSAYLTRARGYSLRRVACVVPLMSLAAIAILAGANEVNQRYLHPRLAGMQELRIGYANYSGQWIRNVGLEGMRYELDDPSAPVLQPVAADALTVPTPEWGPDNRWPLHDTMTVNWWRPAKAGSTVADAASAPGVMMQAQVRVPPYSNRYFKSLVVVFLPHDRVRLVIYTPKLSGEPIGRPADDDYTAQGEPAPCFYDDRCPGRLPPGE
jgi:hypothetical protein